MGARVLAQWFVSSSAAVLVGRAPQWRSAHLHESAELYAVAGRNSRRNSRQFGKSIRCFMRDCGGEPSRPHRLTSVLHAGGPVARRDVLDDWFSSWLWPMSTLAAQRKVRRSDSVLPGDVLVTHRPSVFWVAECHSDATSWEKHRLSASAGTVRDMASKCPSAG